MSHQQQLPEKLRDLASQLARVKPQMLRPELHPVTRLPTQPIISTGRLARNKSNREENTCCTIPDRVRDAVYRCRLNTPKTVYEAQEGLVSIDRERSAGLLGSSSEIKHHRKTYPFRKVDIQLLRDTLHC